MTLAQTPDIIAAVKELGPMGISLVLLVWIVIKGGPGAMKVWIDYLTAVNAAHREEREADRQARHEQVNALTALGLAVNTLTEWLKSKDPDDYRPRNPPNTR